LNFKEQNTGSYPQQQHKRNLRYAETETNEQNLIDSIVRSNSRGVNYMSNNGGDEDINSELYATNFPVMKPL
jgi:hypothetical protein